MSSLEQRAAPGRWQLDLGQAEWDSMVRRLLRDIHPVDQNATLIWFSFWPLKLARALGDPDEARTRRDLQLDGRYRLEEQLDSSVSFFYASRYWPEVKRAVVSHVEGAQEPGPGPEARIRAVASRVAASLQVAERRLLGITAVGFMAMQQIGFSRFAELSTAGPAAVDDGKSPGQVMDARAGRRRGRLVRLFSPRRHAVTWDESDARRCRFEAVDGENLAMAAARDPRDYRCLDPRRVEGPIPVQCRSGACGYCWTGVLEGRESLSAMTDFEKQRLEHFGYASPRVREEAHGHLRLACQCLCSGDVTVVIPPWNGVLLGRD